MNGVTRSARLTALSLAVVSWENSIQARSPSNVCFSGRRPAIGRVTGSGAPSSCLTQWSSWSSIFPPRNRSRSRSANAR